MDWGTLTANRHRDERSLFGQSWAVLPSACPKSRIITWMYTEFQNNNCQWFHFIESPTRSTTWIRWKKTLGTLQGAGVRTLELHIFMWLALQWWLLELWPCNSSDAWHGKKHLRWLMAVHVLHLVTCHHVGVAINMILNRGILYTQQISTIRQNWTCLPCLRPFLDYMVDRDLMLVSWSRLRGIGHHIAFLPASTRRRSCYTSGTWLMTTLRRRMPSWRQWSWDVGSHSI